MLMKNPVEWGIHVQNQLQKQTSQNLKNCLSNKVSQLTKTQVIYETTMATTFFWIEFTMLEQVMSKEIIYALQIFNSETRDHDWKLIKQIKRKVGMNIINKLERK